jgi:phage recombination protein Bet
MENEQEQISDTNEEAQKVVIAQVIENKEIATQDAFGKLTRAQINLIKRTIAKDASDDELRMFIQICKGANINPFLRQAHLVPFWDSKEGKERRAIIIGIDGYRAIAESGGQYAGNDDPICEGELEINIAATEKVAAKKMIVPVKATATVYKVIGNQRYPFSASARWDEYYPGAKKGNRWHAMPYLMLGKCAEALALRKAFPKLLSGIYAQEEMDQAMVDEPVHKDGPVVMLKRLIERATEKELKQLEAKMNMSDKYTPEQKAEFSRLVVARKAELAKPAEVVKPETKGDAIEQAVNTPAEELSPAKKQMVDGLKGDK